MPLTSMNSVYNAVFAFEDGDRAQKHNNPGAHIWIPSLSQQFGAEKGDSFIGADGRTYFTAKYDDPGIGERASKFVIDNIWERNNGDPSKFVAQYAGLKPDSATHKNYVGLIVSNGDEIPLGQIETEISDSFGVDLPQPRGYENVDLGLGFEGQGDKKYSWYTSPLSDEAIRDNYKPEMRNFIKNSWFKLKSMGIEMPASIAGQAAFIGEAIGILSEDEKKTWINTSEFLRDWSERKVEDWVEKDVNLHAYLNWAESNPSWGSKPTFDLFMKGVSNFAPTMVLMIGTRAGTAGLFKKLFGNYTKLFATGKLVRTEENLRKAANAAKWGNRSSMLTSYMAISALEGSGEYNEAMDYMVDELGWDLERANSIAAKTSIAYGLMSGVVEFSQADLLMRLVRSPLSGSQFFIRSLVNMFGKNLIVRGVATAAVVDLLEAGEEAVQNMQQEVMSSVYRDYGGDFDEWEKNIGGEIMKALKSPQTKEAFAEALYGVSVFGAGASFKYVRSRASMMALELRNKRAELSYQQSLGNISTEEANRQYEAYEDERMEYYSVKKDKSSKEFMRDVDVAYQTGERAPRTGIKLDTWRFKRKQKKLEDLIKKKGIEEQVVDEKYAGEVTGNLAADYLTSIASPGQITLPDIDTKSKDYITKSIIEDKDITGEGAIATKVLNFIKRGGTKAIKELMGHPDLRQLARPLLVEMRKQKYLTNIKTNEDLEKFLNIFLKKGTIARKQVEGFEGAGQREQTKIQFKNLTEAEADLIGTPEAIKGEPTQKEIELEQEKIAEKETQTDKLQQVETKGEKPKKDKVKVPKIAEESTKKEKVKVAKGTEKKVAELAISDTVKPKTDGWARVSENGYEISTVGDKRFSALNARLKTGDTIEQAYQTAKGSGKGKPSIHKDFDYWNTYLELWKQWAKENPELIEELKEKSKGKILTDQFATTENNQARALATILKETEKKEPVPSIKEGIEPLSESVAKYAPEVIQYTEHIATTTVGSALNILAESGKTVGILAKFLKNINQEALDTRIYTVKNLKAYNRKTKEWKSATGVSNVMPEGRLFDDDSIFINADVGVETHGVLNDKEVTVLHETAHLITERIIQKKNPTGKEFRFQNEIKRLLDLVTKESTKFDEATQSIFDKHSLDNVSEFVAYTFTDPNFKKIIATIQDDVKSKQTVWNSLLDAIKKVLGIVSDGSVLDTAFNEIMRILPVSTEVLKSVYKTKNIVMETTAKRNIKLAESTRNVDEDDVELSGHKITIADGTEIELTKQQKIALDGISDWFKDVWANKKDLTFTDRTFLFAGFAGTGKTTLLNEILKNLKKDKSFTGKIAITAPTHVAVNVNRSMMSDEIKASSLTLQSLLGLLPNFSTSNFDVAKLDFAVDKNAIKIDGYDIIIIDEASMVNRALYSYLKENFTDKIILFSGDSAQIQPIGEKLSDVFTDDEMGGQLELTQVMRTKGDNPLKTIFTQIRRKLNAFGDQFSHRDVLNEQGQGVMFIKGENKMQQMTNFMKKVKEVFTSEDYKANTNSRIFAYKNKAVDEYNKQVRAMLFPDVTAQIVKGETLIANETVADKKRTYIANSGTYTVEEVFHNKTSDGISVYDVTIREKFGAGVASNISIVDDADKQGVSIYLNKVLMLKRQVNDATFPSEKRKLHKVYDDYIKNHIPMKKYFTKTDGFIIKNYVAYGYASTVHKAQGQTYKNVFVDEASINAVPGIKKFILKKEENRLPTNEELTEYHIEKNRLKYTAFTRATDNVYVLSQTSYNQSQRNLKNVFTPKPKFQVESEQADNGYLSNEQQIEVDETTGKERVEESTSHPKFQADVHTVTFFSDYWGMRIAKQDYIKMLDFANKHTNFKDFKKDITDWVIKEYGFNGEYDVRAERRLKDFFHKSSNNKIRMAINGKNGRIYRVAEFFSNYVRERTASGKSFVKFVISKKIGFPHKRVDTNHLNEGRKHPEWSTKNFHEMAIERGEVNVVLEHLTLKDSVIRKRWE